MQDAKDLARFLQIVSGIFGAGALLLCLFKMITNGDEAQSYIKKIKNILIALILILSVTTIINIIPSYINPNSNSNFMSIGKSPTEVKQILATTTYSDKDSKGRKIVMIGGTKCVVTNGDGVSLYYKVDKDDDGNKFISKIGYKTNLFNTIGMKKAKYSDGSDIKVDILKKYQDVQGSWTDGASKQDVFALRIHGTDENNYPANKRFDNNGNSQIYENINSNGWINTSTIGSNFSTSAGRLAVWINSDGDLVISDYIQNLLLKK